MVKSIKRAYFCWLFGGLFGLHHFYLRRYKQGFIWSITFGGFLIGWVRDVYRIPEYLKEVNEDPEYYEQLKKMQSQLKTPLFFSSRFFSSLIVSYSISYVLQRTLYNDPKIEFDPYLVAMNIFIPAFISILVYLICTEGPMVCSFKWPFFGSYVAFAVDYFRNSGNYLNSVILATLFLNWNLDWDTNYLENKKKKKLFKSLLLTSIGFSFMFCCYTLCVVNNMKIEKNGRNITIRESFEDIWNGPEMKQIKETIKILYEFYKAHGLRNFINYVYYGYDPESIRLAYEVNLK